MTIVADACQRWRDRRHTFRRAALEGGFDRSRYDVAPIAEAVASAFVTRHHYSGSYPASRLRYGLFDRGVLVGAAVLSVPCRKEVLTAALPELEPYAESVELGRFVLLDSAPANTETYFLARAFELARRDGVRGVVSFSDPHPRRTAGGETVFAGHVGTIYQAKGATYTGTGRPRTIYLLPDGAVFSDRAISKIRAGERGHDYAERLLVSWGARARHGEAAGEWLAAAFDAANVRRVRHPGNHRYVFTLGSARERRRIRLGLGSLPYPKRGEAIAA